MEIFSGILLKIGTFLISEHICGDKCLGQYGNDHFCICGSQNLQFDDLQNQNIYCCSDKCLSQYSQYGDKNVNCPNGNFHSFTEPCNMTCPIAKVTSSIALSTEKCPNKGQCFDARDKRQIFNEVCIHTAKLSGEDFAKYCGTVQAEICKNNVTTKNKFSQCIVSGSNNL